MLHARLDFYQRWDARAFLFTVFYRQGPAPPRSLLTPALARVFSNTMREVNTLLTSRGHNTVRGRCN